jgi:hypothetical protein
MATSPPLGRSYERATFCAADCCCSKEPSVLRMRGHDRYRRSIGLCRADGWDLGAAMVGLGMARAFTRVQQRLCRSGARRDRRWGRRARARLCEGPGIGGRTARTVTAQVEILVRRRTYCVRMALRTVSGGELFPAEQGIFGPAGVALTLAGFAALCVHAWMSVTSNADSTATVTSGINQGRKLPARLLNSPIVCSSTRIRSVEVTSTLYAATGIGLLAASSA